MRRLLPLVLFLVLWVPVARAWTWPVDGAVVQGFAYDPAHKYAGGQHRGIDIAASATGVPVLAPAAGTVAFAGSVGSNGGTVTIETADGYDVSLTHLGSVTVAKDDAVAEGAAIGTVGPTGTPEVDGPYVHLGIRLAADKSSYLDPIKRSAGGDDAGGRRRVGDGCGIERPRRGCDASGHVLRRRIWGGSLAGGRRTAGRRGPAGPPADPAAASRRPGRLVGGRACFRRAGDSDAAVEAAPGTLFLRLAPRPRRRRRPMSLPWRRPRRRNPDRGPPTQPESAPALPNRPSPGRPSPDRPGSGRTPFGARGARRRLAGGARGSVVRRARPGDTGPAAAPRHRPPATSETTCRGAGLCRVCILERLTLGERTHAAAASFPCLPERRPVAGPAGQRRRRSWPPRRLPGPRRLASHPACRATRPRAFAREVRPSGRPRTSRRSLPAPIRAPIRESGAAAAGRRSRAAVAGPGRPPVDPAFGPRRRECCLAAAGGLRERFV